MQGAAQSFHLVTSLPFGGFGEGCDNSFHCFPRQDAGNVMGYRGHDFTTAPGGQVGKDGSGDLPGHVGKSVAVVEKKRGATMAVSKELYGFAEGEDFSLFFRPLACARCLSLCIKAVLRASSCARSSVEADDKVPTPVFEKFGSGL
jgi:hypothetical protein